MKPVQPDDTLAKIVGSKPLPRSEVTKKIWDYIKKNKLQDAKKKTLINADDVLKAVFGGKKQVTMFEMTKHVSGHVNSLRFLENCIRRRVGPRKDCQRRGRGAAKLAKNDTRIVFRDWNSVMSKTSSPLLRIRGESVPLMEFPDAVFVDTSVLRGNHYNFASTQISSFVAVAKAKGLKLLLPRPTSDEIERHIWEGAKKTVEQLRSLFRKSPSLRKWNVWSEALISEHAEVSLGRVAMEEWYEFLKSFSVARLAYDGISIERVMEWYRWGFAPFGKGAKRKEFPDAFAIASLALYANKEGANVAVVAHDQDFKRACAREPRLLHFSSLPELTQLLLS